MKPPRHKGLFPFLISFLLFGACVTAQTELTDIALHNALLHSFDSSDFKEAARLLELMKKSYPDRYARLPYALLYAKVLSLQGDAEHAFSAYQEVNADQRWRKFSILPLARIAALNNKPDQAIALYKEYLRDNKNHDDREIALEALDYCVLKGKASDLVDMAQTVEGMWFLQRTAQYYLARSYQLEKNDQLARTLFLSLIRKGERDDVTSLSLSQLDSIDGKSLSEDEKAERGKLAVDVWNFRLARQYLEPIALDKPEYAYQYARSLYFLGDLDGAKKAYATAIERWPDDSIAKLCRSQYANVCLRSGDYQKALELLGQLPDSEDNVFRRVEAMRAMSKFSQAIQLLNPFSTSRNWRARTAARFLRGRILFQTARYKDALADFTDASSPRSSIDTKEALMWKARTLEKMGRKSDAVSIYRRLSNGTDYFGLKASEALGSAPRSNQSYTIQYSLCRFPDSSKEDQIKSRIEMGDLLPALLYLHLYEEASDLLPDVSLETWKLLEINGNDRLERFLGLTQLATLGQDYATATYYSELFLKALPKRIPPLSLPKEMLQVLFPLPYKDAILKFSKDRDVDPLLVLSIMKQESRFKRFARSGAFARGLMQLIPETAGKIAVALGLANFQQDQLYLPDVAINIGTKYIQDLTKEFGQQVEIVAAGYNGGELNLRRWLATSTPGETLDFFSNIDMSETKKYVMIVKTNYETYKKIYGAL